MARKLARKSNTERVATASDSVDADQEARDRKPTGHQIQTETDSPATIDRRSYLRLGGIALGATGASMSGHLIGRGTAMERDEFSFQRVVHAVNDLGLDPNGNSSIHQVIASQPSGTLVQFPEGEFLFADPAIITGKVIGLESIGSERAQFVVPRGYNDLILNVSGCPAVLISGFTVDITPSSTSAGFRLLADNFLFEDIEFIGRADIEGEWQVNALNTAVESSTGRGVIRNFIHREGHWATYGGAQGGRQGIYAGPAHRGRLSVVDCDMRECSNGIYASRNYGEVQVEDSHFQNNNAAGVRISGEGSYVDNCTFVTDPALYHGSRTFEDTAFHHRGVVTEERFDHISHQKAPGVEVRNCEFRIEDNPANGAAIHRYGNGRTLRVENTRIEYNNDGYRGVILVDTGGFGMHGDAAPPKQLELVDSVVYGSGDVSTAISIDESDDSRIENSIIYMQDGSQDGVTISNSVNCEIRDSTISVPNRATVFNNADVSTVNVSNEEPDDLDIGSDQLAHQLRIVADVDADPFEYTFTVGGAVEAVTSGDYPANPDNGDNITENPDGTVTVDGIVAGYDGSGTRWGGDTYRFEGDVLEFVKEGPATVYLDGAVIDPIDLVVIEEDDGGDGTNPDDGSTDQLRIIADDEAEAFTYSFTVHGEVTAIEDGDYPANPDLGDEIVDNGDGTVSVEGVVAGYDGDDTRWGGDTYAFTGELLSFSKDGPATVLLNGEVIDPAEFTAPDGRILSIGTKLYADTVSYTVTIAGPVERVSRGSVLDDSDETESHDVETITALDDSIYQLEGELTGGERVRYRFDGPIKSLRLSGPGSVTVDDEEVDPTDYGLPDQLTIVGLGSLSQYAFTIDGELTVDPHGPQDVNDDIFGSSAEGAVLDGLASFRFDGDLVNFELTGDASVYLNGQQVDPTLLGGDDDPTLSNWIVVHGDDTLTEYELVASESIHKAPDLGSVDLADEIDGNYVSGSIETGSDGYRFNGELIGLWVFGSAELQFNT